MALSLWAFSTACRLPMPLPAVTVVVFYVYMVLYKLRVVKCFLLFFIVQIIFYCFLYSLYQGRRVYRPRSLYYPAITYCVLQSMHRTLIFFVALKLLPQQGQIYLRVLDGFLTLAVGAEPLPAFGTPIPTMV